MDVSISSSPDEDDLLSLATLPHVIIRQLLKVSDEPHEARHISKRWNAIADDYVKKTTINEITVSIEDEGRLNVLIGLPPGQTPFGIDRWMKGVPADGDVLTRAPLHIAYFEALPCVGYLPTLTYYAKQAIAKVLPAILRTIIIKIIAGVFLASVALTIGLSLLWHFFLSRSLSLTIVAYSIPLLIGNYFLSNSVFITLLILSLIVHCVLPKLMGYLVPNRWVILDALDRAYLNHPTDEEDVTWERLVRLFNSCEKIDVLKLRNLDRLRFAILRDCLGSVPIGRLEVEVFKSTCYEYLNNEADIHALAEECGVSDVVITESQLSMDEFHQLYQW